MSGKPRCLNPAFCPEQNNSSGKCDRQHARKLYRETGKITCIYQSFGMVHPRALSRCNLTSKQNHFGERLRLKAALKANEEKLLEATM